MRLAAALALAFVFPALAGCFHEATTPPPTNIGGDGNGDGNGATATPGKHLSVAFEGGPFSEGGKPTLVFTNTGDTTLDGALLVELVDPSGFAIARTEQPGVKLVPGASVRFSWGLPAKLEGGTYAWNATLDGASASVTAPVGGSAGAGEGPIPLGVSPPALEVSTPKTTFERDEPILITLKNTGGHPARGRVNVSIHGPATSMPTGGTHTAPEVTSQSLLDVRIDPGSQLTIPAMLIPLGAIPVGTPQYYIFVEWARGGRAVTNLFIDNQTARPTPTPGILQRSFEAGPTYNWDGNRTITVAGASGAHPFKIYLHHATTDDVSAGHAPASLVPSPGYVTSIESAFVASWNKYKEQGWALPQIPIHAYIDNPGGEALGTFQPSEYGGHIIIGPESLHTDKSVGARTTVAHELFHAFQTSYDYDEGFLVEGFATWIMDLPFSGSKDYLGQARAFINNPDDKPLQYREHELVLFTKWVADKHGFAKMKELTEKTRDYDNEAVFAATFGKSFDALWIEFVNDLAKRNVAGRIAGGAAGDSDELFEKTGVFGLKAWEFYYDGSATPRLLSTEKAARTLKLPISNFEVEMIDEDVGQVKHAYGIDVYRVTPDGASPPTSSDDVKVKFTTLDADTVFTVLLATRPEGSSGAWSVQTMTSGTAVTVADLQDTDALVFITRAAAGNGKYEIELRP